MDGLVAQARARCRRRKRGKAGKQSDIDSRIESRAQDWFKIGPPRIRLLRSKRGCCVIASARHLFFA